MKYSQDLVNILRIIKTKNIGNITFLSLLSKLKTYEDVIRYTPEISKQTTSKEFSFISEKEVIKELEYCYKNNIHIITYKDKNYPTLLKTIYNYPIVLYVKGNADLLRKKSCSIIGARNCSLAGQENAKYFAFEIAKKGYVISSGLAKGIDTYAHLGSLDIATVAYLGCGIDIVYPKANQKLYDSICEKGALVSIFPPKTPAIANNFPKRNALIAGASRGTLIIEATIQSGSLITANLALDYNRQVMSIPGSPNNPLVHGNNYLIKNGCYLIEKPSDVIDLLNNYNNSTNTIKDKFDTIHTESIDYGINMNKVTIDQRFLQKLLSMLSEEAVSIDALIRSTDNHPDLMLAILSLELNDKIIRSPGNKIALNTNIIE